MARDATLYISVDLDAAAIAHVPLEERVLTDDEYPRTIVHSPAPIAQPMTQSGWLTNKPASWRCQAGSASRNCGKAALCRATRRTHSSINPQEPAAVPLV